MYMSKHKASVIIHRFLRNSLDTWNTWDSDELLDMLEWWKLEYDDLMQVSIDPPYRLGPH